MRASGVNPVKNGPFSVQGLGSGVQSLGLYGLSLEWLVS